MASPSDPTESCSDPVAELETLSKNPGKIEELSVEQMSVSVENFNSVADKALNLESKQVETETLQDPEESDAKDQQLEALIEESRNEEDDMDATHMISSSSYRRGGGPKKKKGSQKKRKQEEKSKEKLEVLLKTLKPVAFVPNKTLDFSRHEKLLKTLGLWDFLHLEFDQYIRQDLVASLVAYYSTESRCSYVNGARINTSRADLARALKLPKKKGIVITEEEEKEILENDESIRFIEVILSTWILLQKDDIWIIPADVFEWGRHQKQLEKIDWAGLLWFMVERELKAEPPLGDCLFASHMQLLIKSQKEDLLREKSKVDEEDDDDVEEVEFLVKTPKEDCLEVKEQSVGATDTKEEKYVEEHMIELNLGQEAVSEMVSEERGPVEGHAIDIEEDKKEEDEKWSWNEDTHGASHFLRRCDLSTPREEDEDNKVEGSMEMGEDEPAEDVEEEETEEDKEKHEEGFPFFPNGDSIRQVPQENLILGDASPLGYSSGLQIHGNSTGGDFLASPLFGNGNNKREIDNISYQSHKRLRTEELSWDEKPPPVEICMDQIEYWVEKAKLSCAEKDQERGQSVMNQEYLMNELQNKTAMFQELERTKIEESQRKDLIIYKLENDLRMMTSVIEEYRKALKATKMAAREHRLRCPLRDEQPVYKDVKGSGGLVLSITEIEKLRLKQEEEDKITKSVIKRQIEEFESDWVKVFEEHMENLELLKEIFDEVEIEMKIWREETFPESKNLETSEVDAAVTEES